MFQNGRIPFSRKGFCGKGVEVTVAKRFLSFLGIKLSIALSSDIRNIQTSRRRSSSLQIHLKTAGHVSRLFRHDISKSGLKQTLSGLVMIGTVLAL